MPEPRAIPLSSPPAMWPATLPNPQEGGFSITGGNRVEPADVLFGVTRLAVKARTASMMWSVEVWLTSEQQEIFEEWYRDVIENHDGEFYARWVGGSRIVALCEPYGLTPLGKGWALTARLIRTRIDDTACNDFIESVFGAIYRAELAATDIYQADLSATDIYSGDFDLTLIADNEC